MLSLIDPLLKRLAFLLPGELKLNESSLLLGRGRHSFALSQWRARVILDRVRLLAFLFAVLTPMWALVDLMAFAFPLWLGLAAIRLLACAAFVCLLLFYRSSGNLFHAYRALALLLAIPTAFFIASQALISGYQLTQFAAAVATGYAYLPLVLMAGLAIFPLTLRESLLLGFSLLLAYALAGYLSWTTLILPSFAGVFWLLFLIAGAAISASLSQLAFMVALVSQSIRDPLTGSFSRESGMEILQLHWDTSRRNDTGLAVAFVDLDYFKAVNDSFGHRAGDQALRDSASRMLASLRSSDSLFRWGGGQFVVIMPNTDVEQAQRALERIARSGLGRRPDGEPITASIGLAERCVDFAENYQHLLQLAEKRLCRAKAAGHNRLCCAPNEGA